MTDKPPLTLVELDDIGVEHITGVIRARVRYAKQVDADFRFTTPSDAHGAKEDELAERGSEDWDSVWRDFMSAVETSKDELADWRSANWFSSWFNLMRAVRSLRSTRGEANLAGAWREFREVGRREAPRGWGASEWARYWLSILRATRDELAKEDGPTSDEIIVPAIFALACMGIESVADLLTHYPRRYEDRTQSVQIADAKVGDKATFAGEVRRVRRRPTRNRRDMVEATLEDGTGTLRLVFFNQPWMLRQLTNKPLVSVFGTVTEYRRQLQLNNPVVEPQQRGAELSSALDSVQNLLDDEDGGSETDAAHVKAGNGSAPPGAKTGVMKAIYPASDTLGISTWELGAWIQSALSRCGLLSDGVEGRGLADPVPLHVLDAHGLPQRAEALRMIHFPGSYAQAQLARQRLALDEMLRLQLLLRRNRLEREASQVGIRHATNTELVRQFHRSLPFDLTVAQQRAVAEFNHDLASTIPMRRLLQGDVGSGKTVVALHALLTAVANGHQGAFMAPISVLADQHYLTLRHLLAGLTVADPGRIGGARPVAVRLLTGGLPAAEAREVRAQLASGEVDIVVGTHALVQESVEFSSLSMVVVDEQHRFGVDQRSLLRESGRSDSRMPDVLIMTATPIPRTAALTVYGDLDVSVLDELPPGRQAIDTSIEVGPTGAQRVLDVIQREAAAGNHAFVVCPLVEDSEELTASAAESTFAELSRGPLRHLRLGLIHGRMRPFEKEAVMDGLRSGQFDVLVATTVIEVGVDVPRATVMAVLNADRFGLATLHQLRGRVGRSERPSVCLLAVDGEVAPTAQRRLEAMVNTNDGFELAELDLEIRGEGTLRDERQAGRSDFKLASITRDVKWVSAARQAALELLTDVTSLRTFPGLEEEVDWFGHQQGAAYLDRS